VAPVVLCSVRRKRGGRQAEMAVVTVLHIEDLQENRKPTVNGRNMTDRPWGAFVVMLRLQQQQLALCNQRQEKVDSERQCGVSDGDGTRAHTGLRRHHASCSASYCLLPSTATVAACVGACMKIT